MLAQIALYPDALLSQVLMASTYPDEFQQAAAWSKSNPDAKGDDAVTSVESKGWDPSVASLVAFPEVVVTLGEKPDYVKNLGDAFLAQPEDVMNSVQRLRAAAQKAGNLASNEQIKVTVDPAPPLQQAATPPATTTVVQAPPVTQTIIIEPAQPQVVYVPQYNPTVVYGPWWWPSYPPYYYPPPPGYWWSPVGGAVARGIAWGAGFAVGNALWGGSNWGRGDVDINVNRYNNINVNNRIEGGGNRSNWSHNTDHRKTSYRGGEGQRQNLQNKAASTNRAAVSRQGRRSKPRREPRTAQQAMQKRGVDARVGLGARAGAERRSQSGRSRVGAAAGAERGSRRGAATGAERRPQRSPAAGPVGLARQRDAWRRQLASAGAAGPRRVEQRICAARVEWRRWWRAPPAMVVAAVVAHAPPVMVAAAVVARVAGGGGGGARWWRSVAAAVVAAVVVEADVVDNGSAWT